MWGKFSSAGLTCSIERAGEESVRFRCGKCRRAETLEVQLAALKIELEEARNRAAESRSRREGEVVVGPRSSEGEEVGRGRGVVGGREGRGCSRSRWRGGGCGGTGSGWWRDR